MKIQIENTDYKLQLSKNGKLTKGKINNSEFEADIIQIDEYSYHVIKENKSFIVEVSDIQADEKKINLKIDGKHYPAKIFDDLDLLLKEMGMDNLATKKIKELKAPMPGLVLDVLVKEGDEILEGDKLLVLEAMKMENNLKAEAPAKIQSIKCQKGQAVEKNEVLIVFE